MTEWFVGEETGSYIGKKLTTLKLSGILYTQIHQPVDNPDEDSTADKIS